MRRREVIDDVSEVMNKKPVSARECIEITSGHKIQGQRGHTKNRHLQLVALPPWGDDQISRQLLPLILVRLDPLPPIRPLIRPPVRPHMRPHVRPRSAARFGCANMPRHRAPQVGATVAIAGVFLYSIIDDLLAPKKDEKKDKKL